MPTTLECRLLCASVCAYGVQSDGRVAQAQPYFNAARFLQAPAGFVGGNDNVNAAFIARSVDGAILAFRGTLPPDSPDHEQTVRDWLNDADADLIQASGMPGRVHEGFWNSLESLWEQLLPEIQKQLSQATPPPTLYVTGHSKGGAIANLAAMRLKVERGINPTVCTFAGPHPGDDDFAAAYNNFFQSTRFEYADDIVPHLPPGLAFRHMFAAVPFMQPHVHRLDLNYAPVGLLQYIDRQGSVQAESPTLSFKRFESLATLIATGKFAEIVDDHKSGCGGGYMSSTCPSDVCS